MSVLSEDYYTKLLQQSQAQQTPVVTQPPVPPPQNPIEYLEEKSIIPLEKGLLSPYYTNEQGKRVVEPKFSQEDQIKKFGGTVGSQQYYDYQSKNPDYVKGFAETLGMKFPDQETWDRLDDQQKAAFIVPSLSTAVAGMIFRAPRALLTAPVALKKSIYDPIAKVVTEPSTSFETLRKEPVSETPWLGKVPNIYQSYEAARQSGMGPWMAGVATAGEAFGHVLIAAGIGEALTAVMKPRSQVSGTPIYDTKPIEQALVRTGPTSWKVVKPGEGAVGEYYQVPKTVAKKYGGTTQNTFFKVEPSAIDQTGVALSLVKLGKGKESVVGKFGEEIPILKQMMPIKKLFEKVDIPSESISQLLSQRVLSENSFLKNVEIDGPLSQRIVDKTAPTGVDIKNKILAINSKNLSKDINDLFDGVKVDTGTGISIRRKQDETPDQVINRYFDELLKFENKHVELNLQGKTATELDDAVVKHFEKERDLVFSQMKDAPLKGFENKPIDEVQLNHLSQIADFNKLEPEMAQAVMRVVTGKDSVGSLTQAEYVNTSKALAAFNDTGKYLGKDAIVNIFSKYFSPQRWWMRDIENSLGVPMYSKVYVPMENAFRLRNVFRDSYRTQAREIFGKYAGPKFFEERRLVKEYMEGNVAAITDNIKLTTQTKSDLVKIANDIRPLYDKLGQIFDIPTEVFLKDYQPHIQNLGGVYQLYKQGAEIPTELPFFAEYKRKGSLSTQIDDALALFDIYTNAGSNKMYLNPALLEAAKEIPKMPLTLQGSAKSYVTEKLGYAGSVDKWLNEVGPKIAQKMRLELPPDVARRAASYIMDSTYAGALGARPDAVIRNLLQNPLMAYPRLGPKFYVEAVKKATTPEGIKEVRGKGFLVELGVPYGAELLEQAKSAGRIGSIYQKATQALLKPYGGADTFTRTATYWQGKYIWDDALARYSEGKLTWDQFEGAVDFRALNIADQNIIRNLMKDKKPEEAFDHFIRDIVDETQFPYRKGASARVFYAEGKYLGQFGQWNVEFLHTYSNWIKTGQWDKLIRFGAAATATDRTVKDTFGIDVSKWVGVNVVSPTLAPLAQFATEFSSLMVNALKNNDVEKATEDWESLKRSLFSVGVPAGVEITKINNFIRSVEFSKQYKLPPGEYGVYSSSGKLLYTTDFKDIFWGMFGFGSLKGKEMSEVQKQLKNEKFQYSQAKQNALELYQQGKWEDGNAVISQYGINLTPQDFQSYYIPLNWRTYQSLPATLKGQLAPLIFK